MTIVQRLALLFFLLLVACGSTKLHVVEPPARRLGGSFVVKSVDVDPRINAESAREDAALFERELRGALSVLARDGAGDERFVVEAHLVGYDATMDVVVDVFDMKGKRLLRLEVSAEGSKRGWTGAARENARFDCIEAITNYLHEER